ncbi:unnamed protein product [Urochloa humidicola]
MKPGCSQDALKAERHDFCDRDAGHHVFPVFKWPGGSGGKDKDIDKVGSVSSAWGSRTAPAAALQPRLDSNSPMPAQ